MKSIEDDLDQLIKDVDEARHPERKLQEKFDRLKALVYFSMHPSHPKYHDAFSEMYDICKDVGERYAICVEVACMPPEKRDAELKKLFAESEGADV